MKQNVNFIKHLKNVNQKIFECDVTASDISLYNALFQLWNICGFDSELSINRNDMMKLSKIGSVNTYLKGLKKLHSLGFLDYKPSHNPLKGSIVNLFRFDTTNEQVVNIFCTSSDTSSDTTRDTLYKLLNKETIKLLNKNHVLINQKLKTWIEQDLLMSSECLIKQKETEIKPNAFNSVDKKSVFSFDDFWEIYPKKVAKSSCEDKYNKISEKDRQIIKDTIRNFVSYKPFKEYNHPNASTYLNQKRWLDEVTSVKKVYSVDNY